MHGYGRFDLAHMAFEGRPDRQTSSTVSSRAHRSGNAGTAWSD